MNNLFSLPFLAFAAFVRNSFAEPSVHTLYRFRFDGVNIGLGNANVRQRLYARFDFTTAGWLLVLDAECGRSALGTKRCPAYCRNDYFYTTFCNPLCRHITALERVLLCDPGNYAQPFNATQSPTFLPTNRTLRWSSSEISGRRMYGEFGWDEVRLYRTPYETVPASFGRIEFVRGRLMHKSYLSKSNIILGLLPSRDNLIVQLHRQAKIPKPQITFFRNQAPGSRFTHGVQLGAMERADSCTRWTLHTPALPRSWALRAQFAAINERRYEDDSLLLVDTGIEGLRAPVELVRRLLDERTLFEPMSEKEKAICRAHYVYAKREPPTLRIRIDERRFEFGPEFLQGLSLNVTHGCSRIERFDGAERRLYTNTANWALGRAFIGEAFCYGLDYGRMLVGFGDRK